MAQRFDLDRVGRLTTAFAVVLLAVIMLDHCGCEAAKTPPVTMSIGEGLEAVGSRIIDIVETDGTSEDAKKVVAGWLGTHPGYDVEVITPVRFYDRQPLEYMIVAVKRED